MDVKYGLNQSRQELVQEKVFEKFVCSKNEIDRANHRIENTEHY